MMSLAVTPKAPRFHAFWQHTAKKRIFAIQRKDWNALQVMKDTTNQLVKLDLEQISSLSFSELIGESEIIASTAQATAQKVVIKIYRNDPKDEPTPVNVDSYTVWVGLPTFLLDVQKMIAAASTSNDENFSHYANDHVFLVKENPGEDHWLEDLPREVYALLSGKDE